MAKANGPVPKRTAERRRRNAVPGETAVHLDTEVVIPRPPAKLHPIARRLYQSLAESGESAFFEPSDWEVARLAAELTSRMLGKDQSYYFRHWQLCEVKGCKCEMPDGDVNPKAVDAVWKLWSGLLVTEAERRRARLEVDRGPKGEPEEAPVSIADRRKALGG